MTSEFCVLSVNALEVEFFHFLEQYRFWGSILLRIFRRATHDLKNGNAHVGVQYKQLAFPSINPG